MAEETTHSFADEPSHDDQTVMRVLLQAVKGLSPISTAPAFDEVVADDVQY